MNEGCFVTGTDTGVGKTMVMAALAIALRRRRISVGVMKPVETGVASPSKSDAVRLARTAGTGDPLRLIGPYRFQRPLAPLAAARAARQANDPGRIEEAFRELSTRHAFMLVEGVGGVRVPIGEKLDVLGLIRQLGLPAIVVGRSALGGVNHALLTVETLRREGVSVLALVLNQPSASARNGRAQSASTVALLREQSGCRVLGPMPHVAACSDWDRAAAKLSRHADLTRLADLITRPPSIP